MKETQQGWEHPTRMLIHPDMSEPCIQWTRSDKMDMTRRKSIPVSQVENIETRHVNGKKRTEQSQGLYYIYNAILHAGFVVNSNAIKRRSGN